jgi:hypothetical protein
MVGSPVLALQLVNPVVEDPVASAAGSSHFYKANSLE